MNEELEYIKDSFTKVGDNVNLEVDNLNVSCITSKSNNFNLDTDGNLTVKSINATSGGSTSGLTLDSIYPIGSIYMSVSPNNPSILIGGTWVEWGSGRVPTGVNSADTNFSTVEKMGGDSAPHTHTSTAHTHASVAHTHAANGSIYAALNPSANSNAFYFDLITNGSYTSNGSKMANGTQNTSLVGAETRGIKCYGTTASTTPGATGSTAPGATGLTSHLQPYITCYMWKRTA